MNLKREMDKLKKHRQKYFPVIRYLLEVHGGDGDFSFPMEIEDASDKFVILELLDLGYLDKNAFFIKKDFIEITGVYFRGDYPLTKSGELVYSRGEEIERNYRKELFYGGLLLLFGLVLFLIFLE